MSLWHQEMHQHPAAGDGALIPQPSRVERALPLQPGTGATKTRARLATARGKRRGLERTSPQPRR